MSTQNLALMWIPNMYPAQAYGWQIFWSSAEACPGRRPRNHCPRLKYLYESRIWDVLRFPTPWTWLLLHTLPKPLTSHEVLQLFITVMYSCYTETCIHSPEWTFLQNYIHKSHTYTLLVLANFQEATPSKSNIYEVTVTTFYFFLPINISLGKSMNQQTVTTEFNTYW